MKVLILYKIKCTIGDKMATIKDVAKVAGVSVTTVSRALNNYSDVNIDTKRMITEVAKKLNYVPNRAAQNLVKQKNKSLAIILSGLEKEGGKDNIVYRLLSGMYEYADSIDYEVVLYTTNSAHQKEKSYMDFCREHNICGAVLNGIRLDDPYLKEILDSDFPCVLVDVDMDGQHISCITIHNEQAAQAAVELLIEHNHRHIGMINGRKEADVAIKRKMGYKNALKKHGIKYKSHYVTYADFLENEAFNKTTQLLVENPEITALFCASDMMALGAINAARALGKRIPEDLSVIGFDDIPFAKYLNPPLATVCQDFYVMGYFAAKQLVDMIEEREVDKKIYIEYKVLARNTISML
jgi:LacI family transcriptional regulator